MVSYKNLNINLLNNELQKHFEVFVVRDYNDLDPKHFMERPVWSKLNDEICKFSKILLFCKEWYDLIETSLKLVEIKALKIVITHNTLG